MTQKIVLKEYFELCPNGMCSIGILNEHEKKLRDDNYMIMSGIIQVADVKNHNGRIYSRQILEREMENYQRLINEHRALGCLDHEDSPVVNLQNVSHMMLRTFWKNNEVWGVMKVLNTPMGKTLRTLVEDGVRVGISSRALGSVKETTRGTIVDDDLMLLCFDIVSDASAPGAYLNQIKENKNNNLNKYAQLNEAFDMIIGKNK